MRYIPDAPWIGKDRKEYENTVIRKKYEREMEYDDCIRMTMMKCLMTTSGIQIM